MATGPPASPSEKQCPQLSTTVASPEVLVVDGEVPGLSEPRVETSPRPPSTSVKRKRDAEDDLEELVIPEPQPVWVVETLCWLKKKMKRQCVFTVLPEYHDLFTRLLENPMVKRFLDWDKTLRVSDKYLMSMVIAYFSRAGFFCWQYKPIHFFVSPQGDK
ncbi:speedy protein E4A-like [Nannospalax galili]|uniref:speedy protein E4A-like n=1 Tax=Nannospalax galili TaxID=1026970 RepID=UPI0004ED083C|nr:speedy protein E4A-like [Nannospalax galili]